MQLSSISESSSAQSISRLSSKAEIAAAQKQQQKSSKPDRSSVTKALVAIESARRAAGENRSGSVIKPAMYTAVILNELKRRNSQTAIRFLEHFQTSLAITKQSNSEAIKPATHQALNKLIIDGIITAADAKKITHDAWKVVYKDPSLASRESKSVSRLSVKLNQKTESSSVKSSGSEHSSVKASAAPAGFLWKPIADSSPHGLAVLLPPQWTGMIAALQIMDPEGQKVLAQGRDGGVGNGGRQHFRFDSQGATFPDGCVVRVIMKDGSIRDIAIADTSARIEGR